MGIPISQFIGSASAKFETVGATVKGTILSVDMVQQTDLDTGAGLYWDDNKTRPKEMLKIVLQTSLRDNDGDDGRRALYAKGGSKTDLSLGLAMQDAIVAAVQKAGAQSIDEGAELAVKYVGDGPQKTRGHNPPKLYRAKYTPPVRGVAIDDFDDAPRQQQPQYGGERFAPQPQQGNPFPPNPQYAQQAPQQQPQPQQQSAPAVRDLDDF